MAMTDFRNVLTLPVDQRADQQAEETVADLALDAGSIFGKFGADITVVRDWPGRVALVVGRSTHPQVVATLDQVGFMPVLVCPDQLSARLAELAPFSFLILSPDVFDTDAAVDQVRGWHAASPSARLKLAYPGDVHDPAVLIRAIRAGVCDVVDPDDAVAFETAIRSGMRRGGATRERVLAIGAHPDDVEIGCGGTLLDHRRRGDRVSILTLSRGAVGGDRSARLGEAAATADAIGAQLLFGDLPDTEIDEGITTIRLIESVVRALDPTVVYVHSINDNHQDHRAVSTATRSATRGVRRVFGYQSPSATNNFLPTQFVDVGAVLGRKVEVLQMFASQDGRSYLEPELVAAGARYWARHLGANARYAEPFEVIRSVGELRHAIADPLAESRPTLSVAVPASSALPVRENLVDSQVWATSS